MCRDGCKPGSSIVTRQAIKSICETPSHSPEKIENMTHNKPHHKRISTRPLRDNRSDIDYSVLNDGYNIKTSSLKRRKRHSSRPQSEPTVPRQAAQKKIEETKIHLSSQYDNLDLEKIMDSQYPALQLVLLSGVMNGIIDRSNPTEEYITPVLGTLTVHGVTDSKPDPDNMDLVEPSPTEKVSENIEPDNELQITPLPMTPDNDHSTKSSGNPSTNTGNGVSTDMVQGSPQALQQTNNSSTPELHGVMNSDQEAAQQTAAQPDDIRADMSPHGAKYSLESTDNSDKLNGVTNNSTMQLNKQLSTNTMDVKGITKNNTQTTNSEVNGAEYNDSEILPDLVVNSIVTTNKVNTTEDEDEAAEALLQLSKSDTIHDEDPELPLGVLPVDAAPVPITLGKQDVLNAIENFKQTNGERKQHWTTQTTQNLTTRKKTIMKKKTKTKTKRTTMNLNLLLNHPHRLLLPKVAW